MEGVGVWNSDAFTYALTGLERLSLIQSFDRIDDTYRISLHPLCKVEFDSAQIVKFVSAAVSW